MCGQILVQSMVTSVPLSYDILVSLFYDSHPCTSVSLRRHFSLLSHCCHSASHTKRHRGLFWSPGSGDHRRVDLRALPPLFPKCILRQRQTRASCLRISKASSLSLARLSSMTHVVAVKPCTNIGRVRAGVSESLRVERIQIIPEGAISAETIDERMRIDTRYGPTAKLSNCILTNSQSSGGRRSS